jgi:NO-binding membrane sensor protein with MHYT domain
MHYAGMHAQIGYFTMEWDGTIVIISAVIAAVVCYVGLKILFNEVLADTVPVHFTAGIVIGLAVCSMHYTGISEPALKKIGKQIFLKNVLFLGSLV